MSKGIKGLINKTAKMVVETSSGRHMYELRNSWTRIVGGDLARSTLPGSVSFCSSLNGNVLTIIAQNSSASFMLRLAEHEIISNINDLCGDAAICALRFVRR